MGVLRNPFVGLFGFFKNANMISNCSGWVGTHLERDSVPGVSWGLKGVGCKFPNFPSLEMRFALDLTTNMGNSERGWLSRELEM